MTGPLPRRDVTAALVAMLRTATGRPIGDADVPTPPGEDAPSMPYAVVYPVEGGTLTGPGWYDPEADGELYYQATCVGQDRRQAEWMQDTVRNALLGGSEAGFTNALTVTGIAVYNRYSDSFLGVDRMAAPDNPTVGLFQGAERFALCVTPG